VPRDNNRVIAATRADARYDDAITVQNAATSSILSAVAAIADDDTTNIDERCYSAEFRVVAAR